MLNYNDIGIIDNTLSNCVKFYCFTWVKCQVLLNRILLTVFAPLLTHKEFSFILMHIYMRTVIHKSTHTHTQTHTADT